MIILQLVAAGALKYPVLNLSPWLEPRKEQYKDLLLSCSLTGQFDGWVRFFCGAVLAQAADAVARIEDLIAVREEMLQALRADRARGVVLEIVEDLIGYPLITISEAAALHNVTYPPAKQAVERLVRLGILREITGKSYGRLYACDKVFEILNRH